MTRFWSFATRSKMEKINIRCSSVDDLKTILSENHCKIQRAENHSKKGSVNKSYWSKMESVQGIHIWKSIYSKHYCRYSIFRPEFLKHFFDVRLGHLDGVTQYASVGNDLFLNKKKQKFQKSKETIKLSY